MKPQVGAASFGLRQPVVDAIARLAEANDVEQLVLFGSRARGDFHDKSDVDLAVSGGDFGKFAFEVDNAAPTLLQFDFINLGESVSDELRESIRRDGKVLYEKVC